MNETKNLIERLEHKQKSTLRKTILISIVPIVAIISFLIFTLNIIANEKRQIKHLTETKLHLIRFIDSIRSDSTTRYATSLKLLVLNCDTSWHVKQLLISDNNSIKQSKLAYKAIYSFKKKPVPFNQLTLRYYIKNREKDKLLQSLVYSGFSWIVIKEDSDDSKIFCNSVHYSGTISEDAIKLSALSLIRVGLPVKEIKPYSGKHAMKNNSIEIGSVSDTTLKPISIDSILRFKKSV